jgi:cysteine sulfinate desulfinase/cysteine desulfurase-like protein
MTESIGIDGSQESNHRVGIVDLEVAVGLRNAFELVVTMEDTEHNIESIG